jgi:hypothetical protein
VTEHVQETIYERRTWATSRLWEAARSLPIKCVPIEAIAEFDQDCWFGGVVPTCRQVAEHMRRVEDADLSYPVILSADGKLMDGGHRIAKAWLQGKTEVSAVQFEFDPPPDAIALLQAKV